MCVRKSYYSYVVSYKLLMCGKRLYVSQFQTHVPTLSWMYKPSMSDFVDRFMFYTCTWCVLIFFLFHQPISLWELSNFSKCWLKKHLLNILFCSSIQYQNSSINNQTIPNMKPNIKPQDSFLSESQVQLIICLILIN